MKYLLFEDEDALDLQPFTLTRPVYELRVGITTIREKWEMALGQPVDCGAHAPLDKKYQRFNPREEDYIAINGKFLPTPEFPIAILETLTPGVGFYGKEGELIAFRCGGKDLTHLDSYLTPGMLTGHVKLAFWEQSDKLVAVRQLWDIFRLNGQMLRMDFAALTHGRTSHPNTDLFTKVYNKDAVFLEKDVKIRSAILNAEEGPIYIGEGAEVQEGAIIKGPVAIGPHAVVAMGAKIRPDTTIGPYCKVGGEISNCVFFAYSNKAHDGFLGNSVIGEWCNLGAGTNGSNLKNNYSAVKIYSHHHGRAITTGLQFCGLFMGDHSKCGINTMFNTGTVVGVSANVFGGGFPPKFVPSFAWGHKEPFKPHELDKAIETATRVMARRHVKFDAAERAILTHLYKQLT
jgi:UDP-N-acetylglucosamine diphosphorylase/glucosamine-1-phosphate N-acetyltransferase